MSGGSRYQEAGKTNNQYKNDKEIPTIALGSHPEMFDGKEIEDEVQPDANEDWLAMARDAYRTSEDYFDSSIRKKMERNLAHFSNRHAPGSKYYTELYKYRAKGFRPKTRSVIRKNEAQAAVALFSTSEIATVVPENDADQRQTISAEINQQILDYRLNNTIPWFQLAMGAYQESLTCGVVISHQSWDFQEVKTEEVLLDENDQSIIDNETGEDAIGYRRTIIKDTPRIELRPVENIRFSPSADWDDPINTSPYLIDIIPMEVGEVKLRAKQTDKTRIPWHNLDDKQLMQGLSEDYDPIRSQREGDRQDSKDQTHLFSDFDTVWVHRNIVKNDGIDYVYYTLGIHYMLSDPIPLTEEYPHLQPGQRPYVLGTAILEAHKTYPEALAGLSANLQQEANDINNQRRDNVQLVLNRRYYARRGAQIDYRSLTRNIPGSVTEMNDINADIRSDAPPEVTGSSYQEQDRINMDFDELTGAFSTSSVGSNRQLNETVGGMEMLSGSADALTEYQLRTFVKTWVEPVLKQVIQLEQRHETDEALMALVGQKAKLWQRFGMNRITDQMIQGNMSVQINVGFGATNPKQRIEKLAMGMNTVLNFVPSMAQRLDGEEVAKEVFGSLGYDGSERFFPPIDPNNPPQPQEDPRIAAEKMKAQLSMELEKMKQEGKLKEQEFNRLMREVELQYEMQSQAEERQFKYALAEIDLKGDMLELAGKKELSLEQIKARLGETAIRERGQNERFAAEKQFALTAGDGRGL